MPKSGDRVLDSQLLVLFAGRNACADGKTANSSLFPSDHRLRISCDAAQDPAHAQKRFDSHPDRIGKAPSVAAFGVTAGEIRSVDHRLLVEHAPLNGNPEHCEIKFPEG